MQERKTYNLFAAFALVLTALCADTYAQTVHIPDPNLRVVIRQTLEIDAPTITREDILRLTGLVAERQNIADLTGLDTPTICGSWC